MSIAKTNVMARKRKLLLQSPRSASPQPAPPSPMTGARRSPNSATALQFPQTLRSTARSAAVGGQGHRDRQRRGHHPDRHRPAHRAAGDRQWRAGPAEELDRLRQQVLRNLIDETLQIQAAKARKSRQAGRHRSHRRARRRQCGSRRPDQMAAYSPQRLVDPLDSPPDRGRNRMAPPAERPSKAASASAMTRSRR